ncbi:MAG: NAD(P)/FAD-dependent oxidoreductase [Candidatus Hydrogenedentota bacterium]|nr:MAG: NAD(P)/FAD-dependent oxidoreductase [Candidatus Hydrogenedentota bacterium]
MKTVIIGNGIAGVTTALELRKKNKKLEIVIISDESKYFYSRPALMYLYMGQLKLKDTQPFEPWFWSKKKIELVFGRVEKLVPHKKEIVLTNGKKLNYDKLVLATGSIGRKFGWPGQDLPGVSCFTNLRELEAIQKKTEVPISRAVVVGGGLIGIEAAEMLRSRNIPVTFVVREKTYWDIALSPEEGKIVQEEILDHGVDLRMQTELKEIHGDTTHGVSAVSLTDGSKLPCELVIIATGVTPNISLAKGTKLKVGRGFIVNRKLETNIKDIYAVGDCAELQPLPNKKGKNTVEALWYTGKMQAKVLAENLLGGNQLYDRGIWYNSAKFFTIDFHTYGFVGHHLPNEKEYFYRVPNEKKSLRLVEQDGIFIGLNALGIRFRHKICEDWIRQKKTMEYVKRNLHEANFEQEFSTAFAKLTQVMESES